MRTTPPTDAQVCGACGKFEPARHEPPGDPKYGYCKSQLALERERSLCPHPRLVDVATRCFMAYGEVPAFAARGHT